MSDRLEARQRLARIALAVANWEQAAERVTDQLRKAEQRMRKGGFRAWSRNVDRVLLLRAKLARARRLLGTAQRRQRKYQPIASLADYAGRVQARAASRAAASTDAEPEERKVARRKALLRAMRADREHPIDAKTRKRVPIRGYTVGQLLLGTPSPAQPSPVDVPPPPEPWQIVARASWAGFVSGEQRNLGRPRRTHQRGSQAPYDASWVDRELVSAFETLHRLREPLRPKAYGSAMPAYVRDFADRVGWLVDDVQPADHARGIARLRSLGRPDQEQVQAMHRAIAWPARYLSHDPLVARLVNLGAMWKAVDAPLRQMCRRAHLYFPTFAYYRQLGLTQIADALNKERI